MKEVYSYLQNYGSLFEVEAQFNKTAQILVLSVQV